MKLKHIAPIAFATALVFASPTGHGALMDQGVTTLDPDTGLVWLDMIKSVGLSAQSILAGTDPENLGAGGWSFASRSQIETLLVHAGLTMPFLGNLSPSNFTPAASFLSLLGETGPNFIQAFSSEGPDATFLYTPTVLAFPSVGGAGFSVGGADFREFVTVPKTVTNPTIGSWLVTTSPIPTSPVPEPEIYAMMGVGLAVLGWVRRRKKFREGAAA